MMLLRFFLSQPGSKLGSLRFRNSLCRNLNFSKFNCPKHEGHVFLSKRHQQLFVISKHRFHEKTMSVSQPGGSEVATFINEEIAANNVLIFSKTTCPFCTKIKEKFQSVQQPFKAIELDLLGQDGVAIQNALYEKTKQKTVPNIFINMTHVGGCDSTLKLFETGEINKLIHPTFNPTVFVNSEITNNMIMIFSKSYCPFCTKVKDKFNSAGLKFKAVELDLLSDQGVQIQNELFDKTGQKTVPNIFINGKHIGGCDATLKLFETGEIFKILSPEKEMEKAFNPVSFVNEEIANNTVLIFSKMTCPYCSKAKERFKSINQDFKAVELDLLGEDGAKIQNALFEKTGQKTVPNIFINGKHIGGCDATLKLFADGSITKLLESYPASTTTNTNIEHILKNNKLVVFGQIDNNLKEALETYPYSRVDLSDGIKQELYERSGKKLDTYLFFNQQPVLIDELKTIETTFSNIDQYINNNKVLVYSKTHCPFCKQAKKLLAENECNFHVVELDTLPDGARIQDALFERTGQKTVPSIFIHGKHIGGCSDLLDCYHDGRLNDYLDNNFQTYDYDLCVIGGGSGGISAAKEAALLGKKVALFDFVTPSRHGTVWGLGGTCVNVGCIPKKLFHRASLLNEEASTSENFGFGMKKTFTWKILVDNVQKYIRNLNNNYEQELKKNKIDYFNVKAQFVDKHRVQITGQENTVSAQNIVIAVGGRPTYPDIPGAHLGITSDDLFSLNKDPGKVLLVGASYIALECAGFLNGLGYDTTVMVRSILLRGFDQDIANMIGDDLESRGVKFIRSTIPTELMEQDENSILVKAENSNTKEKYKDVFNTVVFAIGRTACTQELNLDSLNLSVQQNQKLITSHEKTQVHSVYAVGDVIHNAPELTPVAIKAGKLLVRRIYRKSTEQMNYKLVPTTVFTPLEYGCVGYSETEAKATFKNVVVYHNQFVPLENALESEPRKCYAKLVCDADNKDKVLGLHVLGPNAGEITQGYALGIMLGATKQDFDALIGIHPTCAEVFTTLNVSKESNKKLESSGC
uniref:Thioredoxin reductase 3 n=2 Tax=Cacopsylla melanoneura TaxID=428564 RepID=A0A8D9BPN9_9HEMI